MGRSQESIEKRKENQRERYRYRWLNEPGFREKELARGRSKDKLNPEKVRIRSKRNYERNKEKRNAQRIEWSKKNKERQLAKQRDYYARNKERLRELIYEGKKRRNPAHGLHAAISECLAGRITIHELTRLYSDALARLDERFTCK